MKVRKVNDLVRVLELKGFLFEPKKKGHHNFYYLVVDGKKSNIYTYFSHGNKEYSGYLMTEVKKQLKFNNTKLAEDFFDCPLSMEDYIKMLKENGAL